MNSEITRIDRRNREVGNISSEINWIDRHNRVGRVIHRHSDAERSENVSEAIDCPMAASASRRNHKRDFT